MFHKLFGCISLQNQRTGMIFDIKIKPMFDESDTAGGVPGPSLFLFGDLRDGN